MATGSFNRCFASRSLILLYTALFSAGAMASAFAQPVVKNLRYNLPPDDVFMVVENPPAFPGGFRALREYMISTVNYPDEARKAGVQGRVFVKFIVERDGSLSDVQILQGLGFGCDEEAVRVVKVMPRWKPGTQSGQPMRVRYSLPVLFGMKYHDTYPQHRGY